MAAMAFDLRAAERAAAASQLRVAPRSAAAEQMLLDGVPGLAKRGADSRGGPARGVRRQAGSASPLSGDR